jgi:hypothetical protein
MELTPALESTLRRYALGDLEEGPRLELEERLVTDPEAFEALGVVEQELTEEYLNDRLSAADRASFEDHFLIRPEGQRLLGFVRLLMNRAASVSPEPTQPSSSLWTRISEFFRIRPAWAVSFASVVVVAGVSVLLLLAGLSLHAPESPSPMPTQPSTAPVIAPDASVLGSQTRVKPPDAAVTDAERRARQQLASGDAGTAFHTVKKGLAVDAKDTALRALLRKIVVDAQQDAKKAEQTARAAGAHAVGSKEFQSAAALVDDANGHRAAGRPEDAVPAFWQATELFEKATRTPAPTTPPNPVDTTGGEPKPTKVDPVQTGRENKSVEPPPMPTTKPAEVKANPPTKPLSDEESVKKAVEAYAAAYSTRQPAAVRAVYPTVSQREIQDVEKLQRDYQTYEMRITIKRIEVDGNRAKVQCTVFHNGISYSGKSLANPQSRTLKFERRGATWVRID